MNIEEIKREAMEEIDECIRSVWVSKNLLDAHEIVIRYIDKATLAEHKRWINQPANEHDERIRLVERKRCAKIAREHQAEYAMCVCGLIAKAIEDNHEQ